MHSPHTLALCSGGELASSSPCLSSSTPKSWWSRWKVAKDFTSRAHSDVADHQAALEHIIWSRSWEKPVDGLGILDPGWEDYSWFYLHCFATLTRVARRLWCSGNSLEFLSWWFKDLVLKQFLLVKYFKLWHNFLEITIIFKPNKRQSFMACVNSNNPLENVWHFMNIYCLAFLPALK